MTEAGSSATAVGLRERYLDLLKLALLDLAGHRTEALFFPPDGSVKVVALDDATIEGRLEGRDYPANAVTMIGKERLDNLHTCVEEVLDAGVPGDLIETGVWRGGASIFMRALLLAHGVEDRTVVVADSFEGLPEPNAEAFPADADRKRDPARMAYLSVSLDEVKRNFDRFGVLDDQVEFAEGWFRDTLPRLADRTWAVIRLDGDYYESTMGALEALYPGLSPGGYLVIDDFALRPCRQAVHDFRAARGIDEPIEQVDWTGAYWRKKS